MKKNIIIVVNPVSGAVEKKEIVDSTLLFAKNENLESILYETLGTKDVENIKNLYNIHKPERIIIIVYLISLLVIQDVLLLRIQR